MEQLRAELSHLLGEKLSRIECVNEKVDTALWSLYDSQGNPMPLMARSFTTPGMAQQLAWKTSMLARSGTVRMPVIYGVLTHEEHPGRIGAGRDAGTATDAGRRVERAVGLGLGCGHRVGLGRRARVRRDEAAGLDDAVEGGAVDDQVLDHRERAGPPGLDVDHGAVLERPHVQLAGGGRHRRAATAVRGAVDDDATLATNTLAAIRVECDRLLTGNGEFLVQHVEHLEEAHVLADALDAVGDHLPRRVLAGLTPDSQVDDHL